HLRRRRDLGTGRGEEELGDTGTEAGPVDPLPGRGEQHLLHQVAQVPAGRGPRGGPVPVHPERVVDRAGHCATTRGWQDTTVGGHCGACSALSERPVADCTSRGTPLTSTRVAPASQRTVTHGWGLVPTTNAHPATGYVSVSTSAGAPPNRTRE